MPKTTLSDVDHAMARLADGDPGAFDAVFDALWPVVRAYAVKSLSNLADGEDAAQRALMKMLENAPSYDRTRPAIGWALEITFWECRTERARRRRRKEEPESEATSSLTPEELALQWEQQVVFEQALSQLSPDERAVVLHDVLPRLDGLKPAAVRKRRQRLLERLRDAVRAIVDAKAGPLKGARG